MIVHRLIPILLLLAVLNGLAINVFEDSTRIKVTTAMVENMSAGGPKLKSTKRPIIGSNGIFWAVHAGSDGRDGVVYLWISKKAKINANGMHYVGPANSAGWPITANFDGTTTEIMVDDGFNRHRLGLHGFIEVNVTFTDFEPNGLYVPSNTVKDTAKIRVSSDTIRAMSKDETILSPMRPILGSTGLFWAIHNRYSGHDNVVYLWLSKKAELNASGKLRVGPVYAAEWKFTANYDGNMNLIMIDTGFATSRLGPNGYIEVDLTFTNFKQGGFFVPATINDFIPEPSRYETNAKIVVDGTTLHVHRYLLCIISPVFHTELTRSTEKPETDTIEITDFSYDTVKNAIDYCYGRDPVLTVLDCVDLLRFANKYKISTITKSFEPAMPVAVSTFNVVAQYAWEFDRKELQLACTEFYKDNEDQTVFVRNFATLPLVLQNNVLRAARALGTPDVIGTAAEQDQSFDRLFAVPKPSMNYFLSTTNHSDTDAQLIINERRIDVHRHYLSLLSPVFREKFKVNKAAALQIDDFSFTTVQNVIHYCYGYQPTVDILDHIIDIARFGHKYRIPKVVQLAEPYFDAELSVDNLCAVAVYAWEFDVTDLKTKCAVFYRHNHGTVEFTEDFLKLGPAIVFDIIRRAASVE